MGSSITLIVVSGMPPTVLAMFPKHSFRSSMARKGNPDDLSAAESFVKALKNEAFYLWEYQILEDV